MLKKELFPQSSRNEADYYPESQQNDAANESKSSILPATCFDVSEDINPLVNDPEVKVRLMICWNTETQETLDLAGGDGESCS